MNILHFKDIISKVTKQIYNIERNNSTLEAINNSVHI